MISLLRMLTPHTSYILCEGEGGAGGDGKPNDKTGDGPTKEEFDTLQSENAKYKQDLEDMRLEVFSDDYMDYLNKKDGGGGKPEDKKPEDKKLPEGLDFENMSKKQIFEAAKAAAEDSMGKRIDELKSTGEAARKAQTQQEIAEFASGHEDFETFRPIMYGLSLDPKNKNASLAKLYDMSKDHVKRIHTGASEEEKKRQGKIGSEKPGGSSGTHKDGKRMTDKEATDAAVDEVTEKLGPIPTS